jgi:hypothetical protein
MPLLYSMSNWQKVRDCPHPVTPLLLLHYPVGYLQKVRLLGEVTLKPIQVKTTVLLCCVGLQENVGYLQSLQTSPIALAYLLRV